MRKEQLEYFLDICKTKSLNESAKNLYISQPALTKSIKSLEDELGVILFERTKKGIFPNHTGRSFISYAEKIVEAYHEATDFINKSMTFSSPINIFSLPIYTDKCIPEVIYTTSLNFPHLAINYSEILLEDLNNVIYNVPNSIVFFLENEYININTSKCPNVASYLIGKDEIRAFVSKYSSYASLDKISNQALAGAKKTIYKRDSISSQSWQSNLSQNLMVNLQLLLNQNSVLYFPYNLGGKAFKNIDEIISIPIDPPIDISYTMIFNKEMFDEEFYKVFEFIRKKVIDILLN